MISTEKASALRFDTLLHHTRCSEIAAQALTRRGIMFITGSCATVCSLFRPLELPPCLFSLHLVHEVKVRLVKCVHPHITVLSSTGICCALWVDSYGVQRSKMTSYPANLVFEDLVVKPSFELSLSC
jgi:hypothetical protein